MTQEPPGEYSNVGGRPLREYYNNLPRCSESVFEPALFGFRLQSYGKGFFKGRFITVRRALDTTSEAY